MLGRRRWVRDVGLEMRIVGVSTRLWNPSFTKPPPKTTLGPGHEECGEWKGGFMVGAAQGPSHWALGLVVRGPAWRVAPSICMPEHSRARQTAGQHGRHIRQLGLVDDQAGQKSGLAGGGHWAALRHLKVRLAAGWLQVEVLGCHLRALGRSYRTFSGPDTSDPA